MIYNTISKTHNYIVIDSRDVDKYLDETYKSQLQDIIQDIDAARYLDNRKVVTGIVITQEHPEYTRLVRLEDEPKYIQTLNKFAIPIGMIIAFIMGVIVASQ